MRGVEREARVETPLTQAEFLYLHIGFFLLYYSHYAGR